jgi:hypothetical protein
VRADGLSLDIRVIRGRAQTPRYRASTPALSKRLLPLGWLRSVMRDRGWRLRVTTVTALDKRLRMHRLPNPEIALELNVGMWRRKRFGLRRCFDDEAIDHSDGAAAPPHVVDERGRGS